MYSAPASQQQPHWNSSDAHRAGQRLGGGRRGRGRHGGARQQQRRRHDCSITASTAPERPSPVGASAIACRQGVWGSIWHLSVLGTWRDVAARDGGVGATQLVHLHRRTSACCTADAIPAISPQSPCPAVPLSVTCIAPTAAVLLRATLAPRPCCVEQLESVFRGACVMRIDTWR